MLIEYLKEKKYFHLTEKKLICTTGKKLLEIYERL